MTNSFEDNPARLPAEARREPDEGSGAQGSGAQGFKGLMEMEFDQRKHPPQKDKLQAPSDFF